MSDAEKATLSAAWRELCAGGIVGVHHRICARGGNTIDEERQLFCDLYLLSHKRGDDVLEMHARVPLAVMDILIEQGAIKL